MPVVDPKVNEVVLRLNKLTQDGRLDWRRVDPAKGFGGEQERFESVYADKSFLLTAPDPIASLFAAQRASGTASLEIVDLNKESLYTFPRMPSIDDLFTAVKQRLEQTKISGLLDEFLNLYE
jgi:hypothetical protein